MHKSIVNAPTVGEIARRLGEPVHRVEYVIRSREIQPLSLAGNARVFAEGDVDRICSELRQIDEGKDHSATTEAGYQPYVSAFTKLSRMNKADPQPPWLEVFLFHDHPPIAR
ncbi:MAG: hypothetical protein MUC88_29690 [Planctomycetes bacterium]|nr:hypothetical protein [Planctomycetota bacterium]